MQIRFREFSHHHGITVYDTTELYGEKGHFRVLEFDNDAIQGAVDLDDPDRILFEYPRAMIHLMEFNNPGFEDVFVIGHGIGTIAGHYPEKRFKAAELDEKVVELSRSWFGYQKDNVIVGDGRRILMGEKANAYDYLILDAFTEKGTPRQLISGEFFRLAEEKLDAGGSVIMNLIGRGEQDKLVGAVHSTLRAVFAHTKAFTLQSKSGSGGIRNIIIMGSGRPIGFQARHMAGFAEFEPPEGYIIADIEPLK